MDQTYVALRNRGRIVPGSLADYVAAGGFLALKKAREMEPAALIDEVERSGRLRGRGGAGFNTGFKWRSAFETRAEKKYVVCNADEGEPGTYKDRVILENDPYTVLEGMLICAHAIGATEGYLYCRGEYPQIAMLLRDSIQALQEAGYDGGVTLMVAEGAGAYVCGEETALLESMEGRRGEPRLKPPYPAAAGLFGMPTVVNNVETFAVIPPIIERGAAWFCSLGSETYPGTKLFVLSGDVNNRTYDEFTTDVTLRDIIETLGGGVKGGTLKAVQVGGSSCPFIPADKLDTPVDFESMSAMGAALGSGSVLVLNDTRNLVDVLVPIARFFAHESCGKCVPCREGTFRVHELIEGIARGNGTLRDLILIEELGRFMSDSCFCPLGQSATAAIYSALTEFREDFLEKIGGGEHAGD